MTKPNQKNRIKIHNKEKEPTNLSIKVGRFIEIGKLFLTKYVY